MKPSIRIAVLVAALVGVCLVALTAWPGIAANLTASKSWTGGAGEVRALNGAAEFEIGIDPDSYRATAAVDHTWGLTLFKKVPLWIDPADRSHVKPAGVLQIWLTPAGMAAFVVLLLCVAGISVRYGAGQGTLRSSSQWMFSEAPGPLPGGVLLHAPARRWKAPLVWSLLGVAMAAISVFTKGGAPLSRVGYAMLGSAFALALWGLSWHTKTLEISASDEGLRA